MDLNPLRYFRRRRRLRDAIEDEVAYLRRAFGERAYDVAIQKLVRTDLTDWGRRIVEGAARRLKPPAPQKSMH
jgi:hypothetical protein